MIKWTKAGVRSILKNINLMRFFVFSGLFWSQTVSEAIIILQQGILADGDQVVGFDEVSYDIEVSSLLSELLVLHEHTMQLEVEHAAYAALYLSCSVAREEVEICRIFPCLSIDACLSAW